jgi:hypothetical protein
MMTKAPASMIGTTRHILNGVGVFHQFPQYFPASNVSATRHSLPGAGNPNLLPSIPLATRQSTPGGSNSNPNIPSHRKLPSAHGFNDSPLNTRRWEPNLLSPKGQPTRHTPHGGSNSISQRPFA